MILDVNVIVCVRVFKGGDVLQCNYCVFVLFVVLFENTFRCGFYTKC